MSTPRFFSQSTHKAKAMRVHSQSLSHVQLKTRILLLGIRMTFGAMTWPAPANLLIAVKQKAYIALLKAILRLIIPLLDLISIFSFSSSNIILVYEILGALLGSICLSENFTA